MCTNNDHRTKKGSKWKGAREREREIVRTGWVAPKRTETPGGRRKQKHCFAIYINNKPSTVNGTVSRKKPGTWKAGRAVHRNAFDAFSFLNVFLKKWVFWCRSGSRSSALQKSCMTQVQKKNKKNNQSKLQYIIASATHSAHSNRFRAYSNQFSPATVAFVRDSHTHPPNVIQVML